MTKHLWDTAMPVTESAGVCLRNSAGIRLRMHGCVLHPGCASLRIVTARFMVQDAGLPRATVWLSKQAGDERLTRVSYLPSVLSVSGPAIVSDFCADRVDRLRPEASSGAEACTGTTRAGSRHFHKTLALICQVRGFPLALKALRTAH